jgi:hypothetical protein
MVLMADDRTMTIKVDGRSYLLALVDDEDEFTLTPREWGVLRRIADVFPGELRRAMLGGDQLLYVALAVVAMRRSGQVLNPSAEDRLLDTVGLVEVIPPEEPVEAADVPPAQAPAGAAEANGANGDAATPKTPPAIGPLSSPASMESAPPT